MIDKPRIPFFQSIRARLLVLVVVLTVTVTALVSQYTLHQFEAATTFELEQEGLLLSDALEAALMPLIEQDDLAALQTHVDRLVATRVQNDIEINIILLENTESAIVASNIPDNIEETSPEEHASLLASLASGQPVITIDREAPDAEDAAEPPPDPSEPDYFLSQGQRFLSVTTPLLDNGQGLGSINLKLSLARIDEKLQAIRRTLQLASLLEVVLVTGGLIFLLNRQVFTPLQQMRQKMHSIAQGDLSQRVARQGPVDEIGWVAQTFDRMLDKLQAVFDREKRFTADVAHELRTPLTALKGQIGVTLTQSRSPATYERTLQMLEKEVDRLARLSNELLFLSRLEQGRLRPHLEEQDFSELLGAIIDQMQPLAEEKEICLSQKIPAGLLIEADADHLIRLFINLLDNAIKYTPAGGQITVKVESGGQTVRTTISDSGPGISPEQQARLFDRFYRADEDRSRTVGGAGLGLAIAAEIAHAHQGSIQVESKNGSGTTFIVSLPLA